MDINKRIKVKKLSLGEYTEEGSYWAEVDGEKIGDKGRAFWFSKGDAMACGRRYIIATENLK